MREQNKLFRMPIKAPSGETVGLMSVAGIEMWSKRSRKWNVYTLEELIAMHEQVVKMSVVVAQKDETA